MQTLRIQTPPARLPLSSANEDIPSKGPSLFSLRLQRFNRFGLCNPLGENQPSLSRRFKLFAMPPVAYGLSHFAFGDFPAFGRGQHLQPLTDQGAFCRRAIFHRTRSPRVGSSGGHDRLERRGREKGAGRFPRYTLAGKPLTGKVRPPCLNWDQLLGWRRANGCGWPPQRVQALSWRRAHPSRLLAHGTLPPLLPSAGWSVAIRNSVARNGIFGCRDRRPK